MRIALRTYGDCYSTKYARTVYGVYVVAIEHAVLLPVTASSSPHVHRFKPRSTIIVCIIYYSVLYACMYVLLHCIKG